jgi:hypothetical protein
VRHRTTIVQKKTGRPVQFEITEQSRNSVEAWLPMLRTTGSRHLFPSRLHARPHISTRQYTWLVHRWVESIGLETALRAIGSVWRGFALTPRKARPITPDLKIPSLGRLKSLRSPTEKMALTQEPPPNTRHEHGAGAGSRTVPTNHGLLRGVLQSGDDVRALLGIGNPDEGL